MDLRVRKALQLILDVRGDPKTTVGTSSVEKSPESELESESGSLFLGYGWKNPDLVVQKSARQAKYSAGHSLWLDVKTLQIIVSLSYRRMHGIIVPCPTLGIEARSLSKETLCLGVSLPVEAFSGVG